MASFEKVIISEDKIVQFIPQKPPIVMIGKLLEVDDKRTLTSLFINQENMFCKEGYFREPGLIENMAQTAAAGIGYKFNKEDKEPPIGFIGGLRNLNIYELPIVGSVITTEILLEHEVFDASVVQGRIMYEGRIIAECELKIFISKPM